MNHLIKKQFEEKLKKVKASKERRTPEAAVKRFMYAIDNVRATAKTSTDFCLELDQESRFLTQTLTGIDPLVQISLLWANQDVVADARLLQLDAVHIIWSASYVEKTNIAPELYMNYMTLAFEDLL
jgi:hypothetical protein